jgi:hypothetical protein
MRGLTGALLLMLAALCGGCDSFAEDPLAPAQSSTAGGDGTTLVISNASPFGITASFYASCSSGEWGSSRGAINPYGSKEFGVKAGCYDVRADFSNGRSRTTRVQLTTGKRITATLSGA